MKIKWVERKWMKARKGNERVTKTERKSVKKEENKEGKMNEDE